MRCDEAQQELLAGRTAGMDGALERHVRDCAECGTIASRQRALDAVLALDRPYPPGPGFDTRFFARLRSARSSRCGRGCGRSCR
jgi:hypothetical protein